MFHKALGLVNINSYASTERIGVVGRNIVAIAVIVERSVTCFTVQHCHVFSVICRGE